MAPEPDFVCVGGVIEGCRGSFALAPRQRKQSRLETGSSANYHAIVYDDAEDQFFQGGYPSQVRRSRPVLSAVIASVITTVVVFFLLRELESFGFISSSRPRSAAVNAAVSTATSGAVQVPSLVGVKLEQAREIAKARGLLISIAEERDDPKGPPGAILAQNPLSGSETPPGTTVQIILSRAVTNLILPPVAGQKSEDAGAALVALGLKLGPPKPGPAGAGVAPGLVAGTEPPAGSAVAPGSTVSLLVAAGPAGKAIPSVVGKGLSKAKRLLEDAGFKVHTRYKYDPCCGEYIILEQSPTPDQAAAPGTTIELVVNEPG
jgi:beta-lactam-binding protein with PASTA domain